MEKLVENTLRGLVAAVRRLEHDLCVDRVGVAPGEFQQRRALAGCGRATAEAGERGSTGSVLEWPEPVPPCIVIEDRQVADLAGRPPGSPVDVAADEDTAADADANLDIERVVDSLRGAAPPFRQDGEMHLVVDQHRAGEHRLQPARKPDPLPAAELRSQRHSSGHGVDDTWRTDADRLETGPVEPGRSEDLVRRGIDETEEALRRSAVPARPSGVGRFRVPRP